MVAATIEVGVHVAIRVALRAERDWVSACCDVTPVFALCESPACADARIKRTAPKPTTDSINNDPRTISADASPARGKIRPSTDSSMGGGGLGIVELRSGLWFIMVRAV
ncbi:MAG TPA: hypothetical protein VN894_18385 [Polyangiaceae bacterium]|nr:hypothetical protein [Polyangiaceae bacterium]